MHVVLSTRYRPTSHTAARPALWGFGYSPDNPAFFLPGLRHSSYLVQRIVPSGLQPLTNDWWHLQFLAGECPSQFDAPPPCQRHVQKAGIRFLPVASKILHEAFHSAQHQVMNACSLLNAALLENPFCHSEPNGITVPRLVGFPKTFSSTMAAESLVREASGGSARKISRSSRSMMERELCVPRAPKRKSTHSNAAVRERDSATMAARPVSPSRPRGRTTSLSPSCAVCNRSVSSAEPVVRGIRLLLFI